MVSALGLDAGTSCAAARAGLTRISELDCLSVFDEQSDELVPLVGHQVPYLSPGLFGFARLLQLALAAAEDMQGARPVPPGSRMGMVLLLRSDWHRSTFNQQRRGAPPPPVNPEADPDPEPDDPAVSFDGQAPPPPWAADDQELSRERQRLEGELLTGIITRLGLWFEPELRRTITSDQSGFVAGLKQAAAWLDAGACDACWIGGVDSYLDPPTVAALAGLRVLRTPANPVGLIPGEAASFLEVRLAGKAPKDTLAVIESFAEASGRPAADGSPVDAEPLVRAMIDAQAGRPASFQVVNLNGSVARANEWGMVSLRCRTLGLQNGSALWIPPLHFGEIGSATGPASIALLASGWARGYAPGPNAMVCLMQEGVARGAVMASRP